MVKTEIKDIYDTIKDYVIDDTDITEDYMDRINKHFYSYLKNPTDKKEETFKRLRDALIVMWLADLMKTLTKQLKQSNLIGYTIANQQLTAKGITKLANKQLTKSKILNMYKSRIDSIATDIAFVSNGIKVNSDRAIKDIKSSLIESKKAISTELAEEFSKFGIAFYTDSAGHRQSISNYIKMKSLTTLMDIQRHAFFNEGIAKGVDLVRVIHLGISPIECPLCLPYSQKVLSLQGKTEGYETVEEAMSNGLFTHPNCDHTVQALELAPTDIKDSDKVINHSEENKKRKEYYKRKGYKFHI